MERRAKKDNRGKEKRRYRKAFHKMKLWQWAWKTSTFSGVGGAIEAAEQARADGPAERREGSR